VNIILTKSIPAGVKDYTFVGSWLTDQPGSYLTLTMESKKDFGELVDQCNPLFEKILPRLVDFYNQNYDATIKARDVQLLTYRTVTFLIRQFLGSYYLINKLSLRGNDIQVSTLREKDFFVPNSDEQFTEAIKNYDLFALQIFSIIASRFGIGQIPYRRTEYTVSSHKGYRQIVSEEIVHKLQLAAAGIMTKYKGGVRYEFSTPYQFLEGPFLKNLNNQKIKRLTIPYFPRFLIFRTDLKLRTQLRTALSKDTDDLLTKAFIDVLAFALPKCYLEGFTTYKNQALRTIRKYSYPRPEVLITDRFFHTHSRFCAYVLLKEGTKLNMIQHGAVYGESQAAIWQDHETQISDHFFTWGWRNKANQIPSVAFKFIGKVKQLNRDKEKSKKLLWLTRGTIGNSGWELLNYFDYDGIQEKFYLALKSEIQSEILLRLLINRFSKRETISKWRYNYPIQVDYMEGPLVNRLAESRLVVIDYFFSTAFPECILMNIPVIVFEENEYPVLTPLAKPVYDNLKAVGIIHNSLQSAADFVNQRFFDVNLWWDSEDVQKALRDYKSSFANMDFQEDVSELLIIKNDENT
jgi:putative transferase (TIGR04331 family)